MKIAYYWLDSSTPARPNDRIYFAVLEEEDAVCAAYEWSRGHPKETGTPFNPRRWCKVDKSWGELVREYRNILTRLELVVRGIEEMNDANTVEERYRRR